VKKYTFRVWVGKFQNLVEPLYHRFCLHAQDAVICEEKPFFAFFCVRTKKLETATSSFAVPLLCSSAKGEATLSHNAESGPLASEAATSKTRTQIDDTFKHRNVKWVSSSSSSLLLLPNFSDSTAPWIGTVSRTDAAFSFRPGVVHHYQIGAVCTGTPSLEYNFIHVLAWFVNFRV
jgi:hypothetical protein